MHSSDPITPHLGLWARVHGYRTEHLDRSIGAGALWRLHAMRRTLWIAPLDLVGVLDAAVGADIAKKERKRLAGWVAEAREGAQAWMSRLEADVVDAVRARPGRGRRGACRAGVRTGLGPA